MRTILIAAVGVIALATPLAAQDATAPAPAPGLTDQHLDAADADDDSAVSLDEFRAFVLRAFNVLDADANGVVTWIEGEGRMIREHFDALDANGDGGVTAAEMDARAQQDHATADQDGDGALN